MAIELKDLQESLMKTYGELKAMGEKQEQEIKAHGEATTETKQAISKISGAMDEIKGRIDGMETKLNRSFSGGGKNEDPQAEAKSEAFYKFVKSGLGALTMEQKALVQDAAGEIIVPADLDNVIYRALPGLTVMRSLASVRPTSSNRVRRISMTELTTGWGKLETSATKTLEDYDSTAVPSDAFIYVEDALGLTKIGEDELEDTDLNLEAFLGDSFANAYASMEDKAFMVGTGHANDQPTGILNGATVTRFDTETVGTFKIDDLIKLSYAVPAGYRKNGTYLVHSLIEQAVRLSKDTDGQYLWQPSLQAGAPNMFNGKPIHTQDDLTGTVATGANIAVFGDFKQGYQIVDRKASTITRLNELYANDGLVGFKYKRRVGGGVVRANAMRVLKVK